MFSKERCPVMNCNKEIENIINFCAAKTKSCEIQTFKDEFTKNFLLRIRFSKMNCGFPFFTAKIK